MKFRVIWFDRRDGEGLAHSIEGEHFAMHISAGGIPGKRTWFGHTACVYYDEGQVIDVERLDAAPFFRCVTPGTFDKAKWDKLDHDRLAFRCDETGKATCGLFAEKRKKAV